MVTSLRMQATMATLVGFSSGAQVLICRGQRQVLSDGDEDVHVESGRRRLSRSQRSLAGTSPNLLIGAGTNANPRRSSPASHARAVSAGW